ncbi:hypothetical protein M8C21_015856 [Ambrosia artemisiifolia]|uniref:Protein arginine N-methyltransferase n=1 Tax=Ambrosia artemisiifolia TaxID=4212 RepID=A0AAD5D3Q4_AMBAR|nr:hypothetical protein M8C21_015856 [Ambrosia artemisiifolia]
MPLGDNLGDKNDSRYCGVETEFNDDMPHVLSHNINGGFDFVVAPLMEPGYRPSLVNSVNKETTVLPFAGSDLVLSPAQWSSHVVGKISSWIDLDSEDDVLREDSEIALKQELAWASHLSLQACLLPTPKGKSCANYARCVNQILENLNNMQLWLRIPLVKSDYDDGDSVNATSDGMVVEPTDSWELWNSFRELCEHHSQLSVALDVLSSLPSVNSLGRWFGEPVKAAIVHTDIVLSGKAVHKLPVGSSPSGSSQADNYSQEAQRHEIRSYLDYVGYLYQKMEPLPEQERFEPLMDNLEAQTYETFEKDSVKYIQYQRAVSKALVDRIPDENASTTTVVLMVVGAGRGPLVRASLQAAEETGRKLKVYAVEKNPNAVVTLHSLVKLEGWENLVTIVSCDMRFWEAPEKADILVSELLGSFGDNELSPECLDGAQRFLKPDGISIPSSYVYKFYTACDYIKVVKLHKDLLHFETAYVVKLHRLAKLSPSQAVFTFTHPNYSPNKSNQRYKKLRFEIPIETGSFIVHGFAGYFDAVLYKDVSNILPPKVTHVCEGRISLGLSHVAVLWFGMSGV